VDATNPTGTPTTPPDTRAPAEPAGLNGAKGANGVEETVGG
jgi:hypothetical protein